MDQTVHPFNHSTMKKLNSILVASDFSRGSDHATEFALKLAEQYNSKIDLLHVLSPIGESRIPQVRDRDEKVKAQILKHAENRLEKVHEQIEEKYRGSCVVRSERKASDAIIKRAEEKKGGYDLIILGTKGEHDSRFSRGDTAIRVIRQAKTSVLTVGPELVENGLNRIVVPTDGSELSLKAVPYAGRLAAIFGAEITLLNVVHMHGSFMAYHNSLISAIDKNKVYGELINRIIDYLRHADNEITLQRTGENFEDILLVDDFDEEKKVSVHTVIESGYSVHYEIIEYAEEKGDLVVMATHGYSALKQMMLGSNAEKVVRNLNKSVLTIRPAAKDFDKAVSGRNKFVSWDPL